MKRFKFIAAGFIAAILLLGSCSTPQNITYFPDLYTGSIVQAEQMLDIRVLPDDKLSITVKTQDEELTKLFNLSMNQINNTGSDNSGVYYTVDSRGDIEFPLLGKIHIAGLTREQVAEKIANDLIKADLVKEPIVIVEYRNTGVAVLGAVRAPGRYEFNRDHLTVIDGIALAGDLTMNGLRENILVMRNVGDGKREAYRVNLLDAQALASSPAFYLQQDDIIYVEPNDKSKRETTPLGNSPYTPSFWISLGSFAVTIATLIITLAR